MTRRDCPAIVHQTLKDNPDLMRTMLQFVGMMSDAWSVLELYNCAGCDSTLTAQGIGPVLPED